MPRETSRKLVGLVCLGALTGCAVVESQVVTGAVPGGIPYFLPKRPFIVTVTTPTGGALPIISIASGNAEPDLSMKFVLSQGTNLLANNEFNVTVGSNGLLESSQSTATSQVATAVQNAASTVGMFAGGVLPGGAVARSVTVTNGPQLFGPSTASPPPTPPSIACPRAGESYQYAVYPERALKSVTFCADTPTPYTVTWRRTDGKTGKYGVDNGNVDATQPVSGLFFRHELPYVVKVESTAQPPSNLKTESDYFVTSPDESETDFFPVKRSFFANNTANITVTDGVLTGVDQTTTSEVAALVGLPATWVGSYMTAVGQLFTGLTTISSDQQKLLQQLQATAVTQSQAAVVAAAQYQVCMKTVKSYNFPSLNAAAAATALAAIQAACPGS
jgi:hypothetical protein